MTSKLEQLGNNKAKLEIEVRPEDFNKGMQTAYIKIRKRYNVPGFRRGKAPKVMIENHYGEGVFYEEAFEAVFPKAFDGAVEEHNLEVVSKPDIDILKIGKNEGLLFTAEVFLKPEVSLGKYKGVVITKKEAKVTAKEVNAELEKIKEQNVRWVEVNRPAVMGDTVVMDYSGSVDGVKFDGGTAEGQTLELGSSRFIPGFEEQVAGMKAGEQKDITVKFPKEYTAGELADKVAVFAINLISVKEKELPELSDEFAQDVSDFDTLADYKKDIKKNLVKAADEKAKSEMEDELIGKIVDGCGVEIPEPMIESQINYQIQQMSYQLMYQGMKLEDYLKYIGKTMDDLRADYAEGSKKQVKMRLCIEAMVKAENINATDKEVDGYIAKMAEGANKTPEEYKKLISDEDIEYYKERVRVDKLFDFLMKNAAMVEDASAGKADKEPETEEEDGKKKKTAKKEANK
jgi:trigger factor